MGWLTPNDASPMVNDTDEPIKPLLSNPQDEPPDKSITSSSQTLPDLDWASVGDPRNIALVVFAGNSVVYVIWRRYLRRLPTVSHISPAHLKSGRTLFGRVASVGDGDNFRLYHTPGGWRAGWGWLRLIPTSRTALKDQTLSVRLAGVDAPEGAHFGRPAQPYSEEALKWLTSYVLNRRVRCYPHKKDQYDRVVATVQIRKPPFYFPPKNVGYELVKRGLAVVYEAKTGAEFGGMETRYRAAERTAKEKSLGLWRNAGAETPGEYKKRMKGELPMDADQGKVTVKRGFWSWLVGR